MKSDNLKMAWSLAAPEANLCRGSIKQSFFSLNMQKTLPWLVLIIYTSSAIFIYLLLKSFNRKHRKCKHYIIFSFFTEISGDEISHIGECSVFRGFLGICCPIIEKREINWYTCKIHNLHYCSYKPIIFSWYFQVEPEGELLCKCRQFLEVCDYNLL